MGRDFWIFSVYNCCRRCCCFLRPGSRALLPFPKILEPRCSAAGLSFCPGGLSSRGLIESLFFGILKTIFDRTSLCVDLSWFCFSRSHFLSTVPHVLVVIFFTKMID